MTINYLKKLKLNYILYHRIYHIIAHALISLLFYITLSLSANLIHCEEFSKTSSHWEDFCKEKYGTTNPTLAQMYPLTPMSASEIIEANPIRAEMNSYYDQIPMRGAGSGLKASFPFPFCFPSLFPPSIDMEPAQLALPELNPVLFGDSPNEIINALGLELNKANENNISQTAINFVKNYIPPDMWSINQAAISNTNNAINQYMDSFMQRVIITDDQRMLIGMHHQTAINFYNIMHLRPPINVTLQDKIYWDIFEKVCSSYNLVLTTK